MSDFHPETWNPVWSVSTILNGLFSFMLDTQPTLGSVESTMAEKRKLAEQSLHWNVGNPKFRNLFPELVTKYRESNGLR
jgi:ubiquitin-conjugating enzyme E2 J2